MSSLVQSLGRGSPEMDAALKFGHLIRDQKNYSAIPREVLYGVHGVESVIFELVDPTQVSRPSILRVLIQAIRPKTLTLSLSPFFVGLADGLRSNPGLASILSHWQVLTAALCIVFLQIAAHLHNDVEDHLRLVDRPGTVGGSGVIQKGWVSAHTLRYWGWSSLFLGILFGGVTLVGQSTWMIGIGSLGLLGVLSYSRTPWALRYRWWGQWIVALILGPLMGLGMAQLVFEEANAGVWLLSLFFSFLTAAVFHAKQIQTAESDLRAGVVTLANRIGFRPARALFLTWILGIYAVVTIGVLTHVFPVSLGLTLSLGLMGVIPCVLQVYRASGPVSAHLGSFRSNVLNLHFLISLLAFVGFLFNF